LIINTALLFRPVLLRHLRVLLLRRLLIHLRLSALLSPCTFTCVI
jgi:hypothetical protein